MPPVIKVIEERNLEHILVHTGQHYDEEMSNFFLNEFKLSQGEYLDVGSEMQGYQTGKMIKELEKVLLKDELVQH